MEHIQNKAIENMICCSEKQQKLQYLDEFCCIIIKTFLRQKRNAITK
jgi:hypothetical protein